MIIKPEQDVLMALPIDCEDDVVHTKEEKITEQATILPHYSIQQQGIYLASEELIVEYYTSPTQTQALPVTMPIADKSQSIGFVDNPMISKNALPDIKCFIENNPVEKDTYIVSSVYGHRYYSPYKTAEFRSVQIVSNEDGSVDFYNKSNSSEDSMIVRKFHFEEDSVSLGTINMYFDGNEVHGSMDFRDFNVYNTSIQDNKCVISLVESSMNCFPGGNECIDLVVYPADFDIPDNIDDMFDRMDDIGIFNTL